MAGSKLRNKVQVDCPRALFSVSKEAGGARLIKIQLRPLLLPIDQARGTTVIMHPLPICRYLLEKQLYKTSCIWRF